MTDYRWSVFRATLDPAVGSEQAGPPIHRKVVQMIVFPTHCSLDCVVEYSQRLG